MLSKSFIHSWRLIIDRTSGNMAPNGPLEPGGLETASDPAAATNKEPRLQGKLNNVSKKNPADVTEYWNDDKRGDGLLDCPSPQVIHDVHESPFILPHTLLLQRMCEN